MRQFHQDFFVTLNDMRKEEIFPRVTLIAGETKVWAHKLILVAASPYFRGMFASGYKETELNDVKIEDVTGKALDAIINYIYTCQIELRLDTVQDILHAATIFQLPALVDQCCDVLKKNLDISNCVDIYMLADFFLLQELQEYSEGFIKRNFIKVKKSEPFLNLKSKHLCRIIKSSEQLYLQRVLLWNQLSSG